MTLPTLTILDLRNTDTEMALATDNNGRPTMTVKRIDDGSCMLKWYVNANLVASMTVIVADGE